MGVEVGVCFAASSGWVLGGLKWVPWGCPCTRFGGPVPGLVWRPEICDRVGNTHLPTRAVPWTWRPSGGRVMTTLEGFRPVTEVTADDRGRVAVGKAGAHLNERYAVSANDDGSILLTPLASIPRRELLVWENDELRASLFRGLADAAEGKARPRSWVTEDIDIDEDDDDDDE